MYVSDVRIFMYRFVGFCILPFSNVHCSMFSEFHVSLAYNSFTTLSCISLVNIRVSQMSHVSLGFIHTHNIIFQILHILLYVFRLYRLCSHRLTSFNLILMYNDNAV